MSAEYVAQNPEMPPRLVIGVSASGSPIDTAVVICGVYPTNQASAFKSVVPVFPAAGRPMLSPEAVPSELCNTPVNIWVSVRAISGLRTRFPGELLDHSTLPAGPTIFETYSAGCSTPSAAISEYACAISHGCTT